MVVSESSRWAEVDMLEYIKNLLALYSHLHEKYHEITYEIDYKHDELSDEELTDLTNEASKLWFRIRKSYKLRQAMMKKLKECAVDYNNKYHCDLKHLIDAWWVAQEVWNTNMEDNELEEIMLETETLMYETLWDYLWIEHVVCWRCIKDELENIKKDRVE